MKGYYLLAAAKVAELAARNGREAGVCVDRVAVVAQGRHTRVADGEVTEIHGQEKRTTRAP